MHDRAGSLLSLPVQTNDSWAEQLYQALLALDQYSLTQNREPAEKPAVSFYCSQIPQQRYALQDAFYHAKEQIPWRNAANRTAGQFILRYPPGIPLLVPGEVITPEIVALWLASGGTAEELVTVLTEA